MRIPSLSFRTLALSLLMVAAACAATIWLGHRFIEQVHRGDLFPALLENRAIKPVEHYYAAVNRLVLAGYFLLAIVAAVVYSVRFRSALVVLVILLVGDVTFCTLSETYGGMLDVRIDRAIPEWFQYLKEASAAALLFITFRYAKRRVFLGWACLFAFILMDDALRYHERGGVLLANLPGLSALAGMLEVRAVDLAEMVSVAPVLVALALFLVVPYVREGRDARRVIHRLGGLLGLLVLVGGVMDLIDRIAVTRGSHLVPVLSLMEDGGEMVVMSCIFVYVLTLWWAYGPGHATQTETGKRWST